MNFILRKILLVVLVSFCTLNLFGQTFNLKITLSKCSDDDEPDFVERYLSIYKDDSLVEKNVKTRSGEFWLNGITKGHYKFVFTNTFGQQASKDYEIDNHLKEIKLCDDIFINTNEPTLFSRMSKSDRVEVNYLSAGCFHYRKEKMEFYYQGDKLVASFYIGDKRKKKKTLKSRDLDFLVVFERQLRQMKNVMGGCTTNDSYIVKLNSIDELQVDDGSCDWYGWYKVVRYCFGNVKH